MLGVHVERREQPAQGEQLIEHDARAVDELLVRSERRHELGRSLRVDPGALGSIAVSAKAW